MGNIEGMNGLYLAELTQTMSPSRCSRELITHLGCNSIHGNVFSCQFCGISKNVIKFKFGKVLVIVLIFDCNIIQQSSTNCWTQNVSTSLAQAYNYMLNLASWRMIVFPCKHNRIDNFVSSFLWCPDPFPSR